MDSRLPGFICSTMSSRSVLLMLLINSIYLKQNFQAVFLLVLKPIFAQQKNFIFCFAYWLFVVFANKYTIIFFPKGGYLFTKIVIFTRKQACLMQKVYLVFVFLWWCYLIRISYPNKLGLYNP